MIKEPLVVPGGLRVEHPPDGRQVKKNGKGEVFAHFLEREAQKKSPDGVEREQSPLCQEKTMSRQEDEELLKQPADAEVPASGTIKARQRDPKASRKPGGEETITAALSSTITQTVLALGCSYGSSNSSPQSQDTQMAIMQLAQITSLSENEKAEQVGGQTANPIGDQGFRPWVAQMLKQLGEAKAGDQIVDQLVQQALNQFENLQLDEQTLKQLVEGALKELANQTTRDNANDQAVGEPADWFIQPFDWSNNLGKAVQAFQPTLENNPLITKGQALFEQITTALEQGMSWDKVLEQALASLGDREETTEQSPALQALIELLLRRQAALKETSSQPSAITAEVEKQPLPANPELKAGAMASALQEVIQTLKPAKESQAVAAIVNEVNQAEVVNEGEVQRFVKALASALGVQNTEPARLAEAHDIQIVQQVVRQIEYMTVNGSKTMRVQLYPESLGRLDLMLTSQSGSLQVVILADSTATQQMLERHLQSLQQALQQSGVNLVGLTIGQRNADQGSAQEESGQNRRSRRPVEAVQSQEEVEGALEATVLPDSATGLNYWV